MASLETTELKLKTTPTGGVDAAQSPYYRRLLSAGYKGFLQGTIGGAGLYGTMGAVVGGLIALPLIVTPVGWIALSLIPAGVGLGIMKGASTFGHIGSVAAINAESADLSEQRRYLLDRYYDLPEGPAGDKEATVIRDELSKRACDTQAPKHFFHWKTMAIGAGVGAAVIAAAIGLTIALAPAGAVLTTASGLSSALSGSIGLALPAKLATALAALGAGGLTAIGALAGAITGAAIGVDRYYIRKWFDHTQDVVHSSSHRETALMERQQQVERLQAAAKEDEKTKQRLNGSAINEGSTTVEKMVQAPASIENKSAISANANRASDTPDTKISHASLQSRLADIQKTMEVVAL
jgi:hypothetical protein